MVEERRLSYCARQLRLYDRERFLSGLFLQPKEREAVFALHAFNLEVAKTAEVVSEPMLGQIRLQWWREAVEGIYSGAPRKHEVVLALAEAISNHELPRAAFDLLIDAREADLEQTPFEEMNELISYLEATCSALFELNLRILGASDLRGAKPAGLAYGLTGMLRAAEFHAAQGRVMIPPDILEAHGAQSGLLLARRNSSGLADAVEALAKTARQALAEAREGAKTLPAEQRAALLPLALVPAHLKRMKRAGYDLFAPQLHRPLANPVPRLFLARYFGL